MPLASAIRKIRHSGPGCNDKRISRVFYISCQENTLAYIINAFYVLGEGTMFHSFPALTSVILFLPLEHKTHIFSQPYMYIISYVFFANLKNVFAQFSEQI